MIQLNIFGWAVSLMVGYAVVSIAIACVIVAGLLWSRRNNSDD